MMKHKFIISSKEKDFTFFYNDDKCFSKIATNLGYDRYSYREIDLDIFSQIPNITKADILELFEFSILNSFWSSSIESDEIVLYGHNKIDNLNENTFLNTPTPTYISEYINTIGQLFLTNYVDFTTDSDEFLSNYKEDKYQAWTYFRDNFFYANAFCKTDEDDILIYKDKEYTQKILPKHKKGETIYSTMYSGASWDEPKYWSQYNILVARTEKGTKYFNEILAPKFYEKYKDLEVEIDSRGNILRWIGEINR